MRDLNGSAVKAFLCICRKTIGWHKLTDKISYSQLEKMTGMSTQSIINAVRDLEKAGMIKTEKEKGKTTAFEVLFDESTSLINREVGDKSDTPTSLISREDLSKNKRGTTLKSRDTKERKETIQKKEEYMRPTAMAVLKYLSRERKRHRISNREFKPSEATLKEIMSRLKDGATKDDCRYVIKVMFHNWVGTEMQKYLDYETLFRKSKFPKYLSMQPEENVAARNLLRTEEWMNHNREAIKSAFGKRVI